MTIKILLSMIFLHFFFLFPFIRNGFDKDNISGKHIHTSLIEYSNTLLELGDTCSDEGEMTGFDSYEQEIPGWNNPIKMIPIVGGEFLMGSPEKEIGRNKDEGPQREVWVDSFWIGAFEITWDQYDLFLKENGEAISALNKKIWDSADSGVDAITLPTPEYIDMSFGMGREGGFPAVNMTNYAAIMFTKWLYFKTGIFYRLPTEAEWEYAARGGSQDAYFFGSDSTHLSDYAWFVDNSPDGYSKVGQKKPNSYGLYDILGNVAEWTIDQYEADYFDKLNGKMAENPWFKPNRLYPRAVRGGSWMDPAIDLRSAARRGSSPEWKQLDPQIPKSIWWLTSAPFVGFRIVRPKNPPLKENLENYWVKIMKD